MMAFALFWPLFYLNDRWMRRALPQPDASRREACGLVLCAVAACCVALTVALDWRRDWMELGGHAHEADFWLLPPFLYLVTVVARLVTWYDWQRRMRRRMEEISASYDAVHDAS